MANNLETLAYRLKDMMSLRKLFSELNYDFEDRPVNKDGWSDEQKDMVVESRIIAGKNDYLIYYIQTNTDSMRKWKGVASRIIKDNHGLCMICSHNPSGFKWVFSSLSKEFSKSFSETRHVPIEIKPDSGVPKTFVEFLGKIRVGQDQAAISIVNMVSDAFDSFAIQIHDELTVNVFEALKTLSEGIILDKSNKLAMNESTLEEIREPTFILLYRIMFILYAEDRMVFPSSQTYHEDFSLKWIKKEWILNNTGRIGKYDVQKRLNGLFRLIEVGSEELGYDSKEFFMRSYYGRLFDRKIHAKLEKWKIPNENLLMAIGLLTRTHDKKRNYFFLDYSALETRHLGAIYEHLLEFHLTVKNGKVADLPNPKERKSTGSYYTPKYIVDYIVENTIGPLIDDIVKNTPEPSDQIDKILDLNVLDPAMGSGHFLVGAVNYMAQRICKIQYSEDEITEQAFVERKRDVTRRCIYGVDLNPLAVDLAHVSLWLETLASERPLSFLSAHLKVGNSLIGSSINDILDKQTTLVESTAGRERFKKNVGDFIMLEMLNDDTADAVRAKTATYDRMQAKGTIYSDLKLMLDAKVAKEFGVDVPPLGDFVSKIGESTGLEAGGRAWTAVRQAAREHSFFHWDLEFPDIFYDDSGRRKENPGFDGVVGNPPWDILEPNIEEFFSPLFNLENKKKFSLLTKQQKNSIVQKLLKNTHVEHDWKNYISRFNLLQNFFKESDFYKFQNPTIDGKRNKIKMNIYRFFVEFAYNILRQNGNCGMITPAGIYSDMGAKGLREMLLYGSQIQYLHSFINKKGIFVSIHRQYKFCLFVYIKGGFTNTFLGSFHNENITELSKINQTAFVLNMDLLKILSPSALSIIEIQNKTELEIFKKIAQFPTLSKHPWNLEMQREFNATDDAVLFNIKKKGIPVYEGKMINQFNHRFGSARYWIEEKTAARVLKSRQKQKTPIANNENTLAYKNYRLVWRLTTNATNTRTIICTILPPNVVTVNSLNYIKPIILIDNTLTKSLDATELFYLCGVLNSFIADFLMRKRISSAINIFHMKEMKIPKPNLNSKLFQKIAKYSAELICATSDFNIIQKKMKIKYIKNTNDRNLITSKINVLAAKLYGLTKNELEYILNTFPNLEENNKQKILDTYDSLE